MKLKTKQAALDIAVCVSLILSILLSSFCSLESTCSQIKENVLRLHIIANSDSEEDQSLKLKVRDAVLEAGGGILSSADNLSEAVEISENEKKYLEETSKKLSE